VPSATSATAPAASAASSPAAAPGQTGQVSIKEFAVPRGSRPHDVAPAADGGIWYTAQGSGELGHLDPRTGETKHVDLGSGSSPHGVILGPDGAPWITDSGLNAIVRVDPATSEVKVFRVPAGTPNVNMNTAVFDTSGTLWWTGQGGWFGRLDPDGTMHAFEAPRGRGPYGITATPSGDVFYASLAGDHIAKVTKMTGGSEVIVPPTQNNGSRRVWSDSKGVVWVSEWDAGQVARYDPASDQWKEWKLPGARPAAYAVYVDDRDIVWLSDFGASAMVRFDPAAEKFDVFPHAANGNVRQIHGRPGEVFAPLSALDRILVITTR
jgi:virginiamycin B lyase